MSVQDASSTAIWSWIAIQGKKKLTRNLQPKYLQYNTWTVGHFSPHTADWTINATPLPSIPSNKHDDVITSETILNNPTLFQIVTPINIDLFESLLSTYPNQLFVILVCRGLREGFWPWANTLLDGD